MQWCAVYQCKARAAGACSVDDFRRWSTEFKQVHIWGSVEDVLKVDSLDGFAVIGIFEKTLSCAL